MDISGMATREPGLKGRYLLAYGLLGLIVNALILTAGWADVNTSGGAKILATAGQEMGTIRVLALGDSLTAGFNLPHDAAFPVRLAHALRAQNVEIINAGVSGDTSAGGKARMEWLMHEHYDAAIVELGANDGMRGIDPERTFANLNAILDRFESKGIPVLLAGMLAPPNFGAEYGAAFKDVYRRLAQRHDVVFYEFFLDGVVADPSLNQGDGIHPTEDGIDVIVTRIMPFVERLLARVRENQRER